MESLQEVRANWEKGLKVIIEVPIYVKNTSPQELDKLIVVLKDTVRNKYCIQRYFEMGAPCKGSFHISVDWSGFRAEEALGYIEKEFPEGLKTNLI